MKKVLLLKRDPSAKPFLFHAVRCAICLLLCGAMLCAPVSCGVEKGTVPNVIIDTDLGSNVDDLFALDLAARMHARGEIRLLAVMMDRPDLSGDEGEGEYAAFAASYLATLGLADLPIGKSAPLPEGTTATCFSPIWTVKTETGNTQAQANDRAPSAVSLYRKLLSEAEDGSVTICSLGFLGNLAALLQSPAFDGGDGIPETGAELLARKVSVLRLMGGAFTEEKTDIGEAEYNVSVDARAAHTVFGEWPTDIVVTPFEIGNCLHYPGDRILEDCRKHCGNPVIEEVYATMAPPSDPYFYYLWDVMTLLPMANGGRLSVPLSPRGTVTADPETGKTVFREDPGGNVRLQQTKGFDGDAAIRLLREYFTSHITEEEGTCTICKRTAEP